jgi:hypothetical protein
MISIGSSHDRWAPAGEQPADIATWQSLRSELFQRLQPFHPNVSSALPADQSETIAWIADLAALAKIQSDERNQEMLEVLETCYDRVAEEDYMEPLLPGAKSGASSVIEQLEKTIDIVGMLIDVWSGMDFSRGWEIGGLPQGTNGQKPVQAISSSGNPHGKKVRNKSLCLHRSDSAFTFGETTSRNPYSGLDPKSDGNNKVTDLNGPLPSIAERRLVVQPERIDATVLCNLLMNGFTLDLQEAFARLLRDGKNMRQEELVPLLAGKDADGSDGFFWALSRNRYLTVGAYLAGVQAFAAAGLITRDQLLSLIRGKDRKGDSGFFMALYQECHWTVTAYLAGLRTLAQAKLITGEQMLSLIAVNDQCGYPGFYLKLKEGETETVTAYLGGLRAMVEAKVITQEQFQALAAG